MGIGTDSVTLTISENACKNPFTSGASTAQVLQSGQEIGELRHMEYFAGYAPYETDAVVYVRNDIRPSECLVVDI